MYSLLIVDDERFAAEGIQRGVNWHELGIGDVSLAFSAKEARDIFGCRRIDVLVCDIEMPDENGLKLVQWVKANHPHTETVFLTCHSEFAYAKQAVQLGTFDYLLKPAEGEELARVVGDMLKKIEEKREQSRYNEMYQKYYDLWSKQQPLLAERFWSDFLSRRIVGFGEFLERSLRDAELPLSPHDRIVPILISVEEWEKPLDDRSAAIMEYAVKKAAEELFLAEQPGHAFIDKSGVPFVMIYGAESESETRFAPERSVKACERFIAACRQYFYCRLSCYIGVPATFQELPDICDGLKRMERDNVTSFQTVHFYRQHVPEEQAVQAEEPLNATEWTHYLMSGNREKLESLIAQTVLQLEAAKEGHARRIESHVHDILKMIYHFLHVKGIGVSQLPDLPSWTSVQIRSVPQFKNWALHLTAAVIDAVHADEQSHGFVRKAIRFMKEHVEDDISREDVARHLHLNSAYLSRMFKKETGVNLIDWMIETKMNRARELLDATDMTVSAIAMQLGYANFSHFTRMFKKMYGVNPLEYRKR